ncbi:MAG: HAMP domain-containing histidine kinase, partial [Lachnospiraceae bacterium]|nr:HAMP domain-containing histidine kinase [Lachnospiraceae bacterium]
YSLGGRVQMAVSRVSNKKTISLYKLFLRYLAMFCLTTVLLMGVILLCVGIGFQKGFVLPANYAERAVREVRDRIAQSDSFDKTLIPFPCSYILMDESGNIVESDMTSREIERALEQIKKRLDNAGGNAMRQYVMIERGDFICVICYDMYVHFASPVLDKWLLKPELLIPLIFLVLFLLTAFVTAVRFGRRLKRELEPIVETIERIARQELGFEKNMTGIRELNAVLGSIEEMGATLEESLKAQWEMEQNRRMQISAVAHDIKIPLTLVRGNVELLMEEDFSGEDMELLEGISAGTGKIEQYLGLLSDAAKAENTGQLRAECFSVAEWMDEIERQAGAQCRRKAIVLHVEKESLPETFYGDRELLIRAVSNILDNAVEYTPQQGEITFFAGGSAGQIVFRVTDSGKGFSDSSLRFAARQFYTECKERSGKHYGLGLFVADMAARRHGGRLMLANRQDGSGAVVTLAVGRAHSS